MAQGNATSAPMALPMVDSGTTILVTLGYLCLMLGVIFLAYYLLRRIGFQGWGAHGGKDAPRLMSRLALGTRQSVAVVRFRGSDLLLGVTDERISLLASDDVDESEADDAPGGRSSGPGSFADLLRKRTSPTRGEDG